MNTIRMTLGISAAFATGILLGFLFAPDSGSGTRKKLVRLGADLANSLNDRIDEQFNELQKTLGERFSHEEAHS